MSTQAEQLTSALAKNKVLTLANSALIKVLKAAKADTSTAITTCTALEKQFVALTAKMAKLKDDLALGIIPPEVPEEPPVTPPVDTSDVLGVRLGKSYADYPHPVENFPTQYLRPVIHTPPGSYRQWTNEGLGVWSEASGDFSSAAAQVIFKPEVALAVDKTTNPWTINNGVGILRAEVENMSNNSFSAAPLPISVPDENAYQWIQYNGFADENIGLPIGIARGYGRWSNSSLVLFTSRFVGTDGTQTAFSPTGGFRLPAGKKPTNICLTSGNEFALVTCIDEATSKGQLAVYATWSGKSLQQAAGVAPFYHDWPQPHPGLPHPAIYCGFKLLGFVDLGLKLPTAVSAVASQGSDRINQEDGNAGTLGTKDLSTQAGRDEFVTGNNATYISTWGFAVVISRTENKAVYVDLRALFAGYKTQYTTTQALYDQTIPPAGNPWWAAFGLGDTDWPPTFTGKPEWAPKVAATLDVPTPTAVLVSENGQGQLAVASEDGTIRFWKGGPADATTPQLDGAVVVGRNVTCLTYDKYPSQYGTREARGFFAVSRGDRSIARVNGWGAGKVVTKTLRDARLADPVHAEVADTHGINGGVLSVCDYAGKQVLNYRYTELDLVNYGGQKFGMGSDGSAEWECDGILPIPGNPIAVSGTNVN